MRLPRSSSSLWLGALASLVAGCYSDGSPTEIGRQTRALDAVAGVSAELALEPANYVLTAGNEWLNSLVYDGQDWVALRDGEPPRLSRIDRDGKLLDPLGVPLYRAPLAFEEGALASDGVDLAAVWYGNIEHTQHLWFQRFNRALEPLGEVLELKNINRPGIKAPHMAFGGGQYLVAWAEELNFVLGEGSDYAIFVMRITPEGVVRDPAPVAIHQTHASMDAPHVSWDGENFLVVWEAANAADHGGVLGTHVTPEGEVLEDAPVRLASNVEGNDLCFANGVHTLVWATRGYTGDPPPDVFAVRVTRELTLVDEKPIVIADGKGEQYNPRCTATEAATLVAWSDTNTNRADLGARFIAPDGQRGRMLRIAESGVGGIPALLANDGEKALALWRDGGSRINADGPIDGDGSSIRVRQRTVAQSDAVVAVGPESALVTFRDERPFGPSWIRAYGSLRIQRVSFDGIPIEPVSSQLWEAKNQVLTFASASDGKGYLVAWIDLVSAQRKQRLYAQRVGLDGVPASAPVLLSESAAGLSLGDLQVAPALEGYLVTFGEGAVLAQRVSSEGAAVGSPFALSASESKQSHARVAFEGDSDLVLWQDERQLPAALWMTRVAADGSVLDPVGRRLTRGSVDASALQMVSIAGGAYAIWGSYGSRGPELHGTWFAHDGLTDQEEGAPLAVDLGAPVLATDGKVLTLLGTRDDAMYAAHLDRKGALLGQPLPVSAGSYRQQALGVLPDGSALVVYARPDDSDVAGRVRVRKLDAPGQQATLDAGPPDSGTHGHPDAGEPHVPGPAVDASPGTPDAATEQLDASVGQQRDAGASRDDAGTEPPPAVVDAGMPHDAGTAPADAGRHDRSDAGSTASQDAGVGAPRVDAGATPDSGAGGPSVADAGAAQPPSGDAGHGRDGEPEGCSCRVAPSQLGVDRGVWALVVFGYLATRRRRSSASARRP